MMMMSKTCQQGKIQELLQKLQLYDKIKLQAVVKTKAMAAQPGGRPTFLVDIQCKVHCLRRFPPWPHGCHNRASSGQSP